MSLLTAGHRVAIGQRVERVRHIGLLVGGEPYTAENVWQQMAPMRELGWLEGRNLHVERRYARGKLEALFPLAEELVRAKVEVIVANGPNPTRAAMRATSTIPIVFMVASDPITSGLVASLARPGGNVTGFSGNSSEVDAKLISLLKELSPKIHRLGTLVVSGNPQFQGVRSEIDFLCRQAGIESIFVEIAAAEEIERVVERMVRQRVQMLLLVVDAFIIKHRVRIIAAALRRGLPTAGSQFASDGALLTYSSSRNEMEFKWASYADRILRGAKPADLPVEQATRFDLVVNLKTARELRLTVSPLLLQLADQVIE